MEAEAGAFPLPAVGIRSDGGGGGVNPNRKYTMD